MGSERQAELERQVRERIERERVLALIYGSVDTPAEHAELAQLAAAAGVEVEAVLPETGEPGHDPRTHGPRRPAAAEPQPTEHAETEPEPAEGVLAADVAEVAGLDAEEFAAALPAGVSASRAAAAVLWGRGLTRGVLRSRAARRAAAAADSGRLASGRAWVERRQQAGQLPTVPPRLAARLARRPEHLHLDAAPAAAA